MKLKIIGIILIILVGIALSGCTGTPKDSDGDGWTDEQEKLMGTNPKNIDTDNDGIWDSKDDNPLDKNIPVKQAIQTPTPTPTPTQPKIEMVVIAPSQILPTINEMPSGTIKGGENSNDAYASKQFVLTGIVTQSLKYEAYKFSSIDEAKEKYNSVIGKYSNYKLDTVNMGDEGVGFEIANSVASVVFRKANVVVQVQFAGQYTVSLWGAKSYAELVKTPTSYVTIATPTAIPTSTLKLVADKKTLTKGETWDIGSGYSLKVQSIEQKTIPKQVWLVLSINGNKLEDRVSPEGETYTYKNIFSTKIESVSDTEVVLKDTYISP